MKTGRSAIYFIVAMAIFTTNRVLADDHPLTLVFEHSGHDISVTSEFKGIRHRYFTTEATPFINSGKKLFNILEANEGQQLEKLTTISTDLGSAILAPVADSLREASSVNFVIPGELIKFPLDILRFDGEFLFLEKPVFYSFHKVAASHLGFNDKMKALIISDPITDPDKACAYLKQRLPRSDYFTADQVNPGTLENMKGYDLLLFSVHGIINGTSSDYMAIGNEKLSPDHVRHAGPEFVYFDSCNTGISLRFIEGLKGAGVRYFMAPITKNEAGTSSTLTIKAFFDHLFQGDEPVRALFNTRRKLFMTFTAGDSVDDRMMCLWRSVPFRLYALN